MGLDLRELGERAPARVVAPHSEARREARVLPREHPRIIGIPLAGVHDDAVTDRDVRHAVADRVDEAGRIRADDVEVGRLAPSRLGLRDVDGDAPGRPDVVEVDAGGHDHDQGLPRPDRR